MRLLSCLIFFFAVGAVELRAEVSFHPHWIEGLVTKISEDGTFVIRNRNLESFKIREQNLDVDPRIIAALIDDRNLKCRADNYDGEVYFSECFISFSLNTNHNLIRRTDLDRVSWLARSLEVQLPRELRESN